MREALRRIVAMDRVACHAERRAGTGAMETLVWHKKHIEERTGRGILPVIKLRKTGCWYSEIAFASVNWNPRKPDYEKVLALFSIRTSADPGILTSQAPRSCDRYL